jgi:hypothetical protein
MALRNDENGEHFEKLSGNQWSLLAVEGHRRHIVATRGNERR